MTPKGLIVMQVLTPYRVVTKIIPNNGFLNLFVKQSRAGQLV